MSAGDDWQDEPIGPDDRTIRTRHGTVAEPDSWMVLVHDHLARADDFIIVSGGPPDLYMQAFNDDGKLLLEYRDGGPNRHYQVEDIDLADVAAALRDWFVGERTFIGNHAWRQVPF